MGPAWPNKCWRRYWRSLPFIYTTQLSAWALGHRIVDNQTLSTGANCHGSNGWLNREAEQHDPRRLKSLGLRNLREELFHA